MAKINNKKPNTLGVSDSYDQGNTNSNTLLIVAIIAAIVAAIAFFVVLGLNKNIQLAPAVGEEGTAQINIISNARIDTTFSTIDFLAGFVNPGSGSLTLVSDSGVAVPNWLDSGSNPITVLDRGFVIENIGNVDLDLGFVLQTPIDTWLVPGPSTTSATLEYKVNDCDTTAPAILTDCTYAPQFDVVPDDAEACTFDLGTTVNTYETIPVSPAPFDLACDIFTFANDRDEVRVDLRLVIPEDISPTGGVSQNLVIVDIAITT